MKRETLEQWVLLQESGELGWFRSLLLRRALARDAALRAFAADVAKLTSGARDATPVPPIPSFAMHRILREAESAHANAAARPAEEPRWRGAYAYVALIALAIAGILAMPFLLPEEIRRPTVAKGPSTPPVAQDLEVLAWDDGLDQAVSAIETQLASSDDGWNGYSTGSGSDEESLAEQLLNMENTEI